MFVKCRLGGPSLQIYPIKLSGRTLTSPLGFSVKIISKAAPEPPGLGWCPFCTALMGRLPVCMPHLSVGSVRTMPLHPPSLFPVPLQGLEESRQIKAREEGNEREEMCLAAYFPVGKDLDQLCLPQTQLGQRLWNEKDLQTQVITNGQVNRVLQLTGASKSFELHNHLGLLPPSEVTWFVLRTHALDQV